MQRCSDRLMIVVVGVLVILWASPGWAITFSEWVKENKQPLDQRMITMDIKHHSKLTSFKGIEKYTKLESLTVRRSALSPVQIDAKAVQHLSALKSLKMLHFTNARSKGLYRHLSEALPQLEQLILMSCGEIDLSQRAEGSFTRLKSMLVMGGSITKLTAELFDGMGKIEYLALPHNKISTFEPDAFSGVPLLQSLSLTHNPLREIGADQLSRLALLKVLDLSSTNLSHIDPAAFRNLNQLRTLNLRINELKQIDLELVQPLKSLEVLDLSYNPIGEITADLLAPMPQLVELDMANTELKVVKADLFQKNRQLKNIGLSQNQLSVLPEGLFDGLKKLSRLYLSGNPLKEFNIAQLPDVGKMNHLAFFDCPLERLVLDDLNCAKMRQFLWNKDVVIGEISFRNATLDQNVIDALGKVAVRKLIFDGADFSAVKKMDSLAKIKELETIQMKDPRNLNDELLQRMIKSMPLLWNDFL